MKPRKLKKKSVKEVPIVIETTTGTAVKGPTKPSAQSQATANALDIVEGYIRAGGLKELDTYDELER